MGEEPITEQQALALAAMANARATPEEKALSVVVAVREKATGKIGLMGLWNEEEADRRLEMLDASFPTEHLDQGLITMGICLQSVGQLIERIRHCETKEEVKEFHRVRRAVWENRKRDLEIVLSTGR